MRFLIILCITLPTYAFLWGTNEPVKKIDPLTLKTKQERMNWLKDNDAELYDMIKNKEEAIQSSQLSDVWDSYKKESKELFDPNKAKREKEARIKAMKEAIKQKMKDNEEKLKQGYRLVNGELISKEEQEKLKKKKEQKKIETERVLKFYNEMGMELPKNSDDIEVKE